MASRSLLAVLVLLLGLHGTHALVCTATGINTGTCTCPGGTSATAVSTGAMRFSVANVGLTSTLTRVAGTVTVASCTNVIGGYEIKTGATNYGLAGTTSLTAGITIIGANSYAPEQLNKVTYASGKITSLTASVATSCPAGVGHGLTGKLLISDCKDLLPKFTFIPSVTSGTTTAALVRACVANEYNCRGQTALFVATPGGALTASGLTAVGSMVLSGTGTLAAAVTTAAVGTVTTTKLLPIACPANSGTTVAQTIGVAASSASCLVNAGYYIVATNLLTPIACPAGSICLGGFAVNTASASATGLYGICTTTTITTGQKCYCPGGTTAASAGTTVAAVGTGDIYGTLTATGGSITTPIAACDDILPGYEVVTTKTAQDITPSATLTAGITAIDANSFAPSVVNSVTYTTGKITGLTQSLATSCPTGTGNSLTSAATGQAAITFQTACVDLLPKFSFKTSVGAGTALNALVVPCKADQYNCPGSANLFSKKTVAAGTGIFNTGNNMEITALNTIGSTGTINQGSMLVKDCPSGSSTTSAQTILTAVTGCTVNGGYFIDASDLDVPSVCPIGDYCGGGGAVGTAGGDTSCPYGSSTASASSLNSRISDCAVSSGFYVATGALNTPVPCLAGFICSGGTPLGTAGGSVACPVGSLHASCTGSSPTTTVSVSATPISVATPDVTVTNTVPSASSASTNAASMVLLALSAAMVAL